MSVVYDDLIRENRRRTRLLLAGAFTVLLVLAWVLMGLLLGPDVLTDPVTGLRITLVGVGVALVLTLLSTRTGPRLALRADGTDVAGLVAVPVGLRWTVTDA